MLTPIEGVDYTRHKHTTTPTLDTQKAQTQTLWRLTAKKQSTQTQQLTKTQNKHLLES